MIVLIDNYDSFTYNLVHYFEMLEQEVITFYNDQTSIEQIQSLDPSHIVISPGPKSPNEAGISLDVIKYFYKLKPILGICLGHQCLGQYFGASIAQTSEIFHGRTSEISNNQQGLFVNTPLSFTVARYHSLAIQPNTLPDCFQVDAWYQDTIMAISHRQYPLFGLQFHPEAILTEYGLNLLNQFLIKTS